MRSGAAPAESNPRPMRKTRSGAAPAEPNPQPTTLQKTRSGAALAELNPRPMKKPIPQLTTLRKPISTEPVLVQQNLQQIESRIEDDWSMCKNLMAKLRKTTAQVIHNRQHQTTGIMRKTLE